VAVPYDDISAAVPYMLLRGPGIRVEGRDEAAEPTEDKRSSSASIAKSTSGSLTGVVARVKSRGCIAASSSGPIGDAVL
jgi:hypothetical protein